MRIGQVAAEAGVSVQAVRYYERRGLLPTPARRQSGYREYPSSIVRQVRAIKWAQRLGFRLVQMSDLVSIGQSHVRGRRTRVRALVAAKPGELPDLGKSPRHSDNDRSSIIEEAAMTSFACNLGAFDAAELQRYGQHRQAIRAATQEIKELTDGYGLHLGTAPETFLKAAEWVVLEHRCCPFLNFKLELTNESDSWLCVTGPDGVKALLGEALSSRAQRLPGA
jgi:DNA-binding transcriptional MerR regulator